MKKYDVGDIVRVEVTFTDQETGVAADPSSVVLRVRQPDGTVTAYSHAAAEITKTAVGKYRYDINAATSGDWAYRWEGTGSAQAAGEGEFYVKRSQVV